MVRRLVRFLRSEQGQGLAEYALILTLIAVISILAVVFFGSQLRALLSTIGVSVGSAV